MFILDPGSDFFFSGSRIQGIKDPGSGSASKEFKYFYPKKLFLSCRKYDLGCSSQIPDPDPDFFQYRIPDPGVKKHRIPDPQHCILCA